MKKIYIIVALIGGCIIISLLLQYLKMNLVLQTILVTILMAILFSIRAVIEMYEDKTNSSKNE